jgi:hypothetical protein
VHLDQAIHDPNWYWAWRIAAQLPDQVDPDTAERVFDPQTLSATLWRLFELNPSKPRPTERIFLAWHRFEVDEFVLARFRWTDSAGRPIVGEALRERGRSLILPGAAAVIRRFRRRMKNMLDPCEDGSSNESVRERHRVAVELIAGFVPCRPIQAVQDEITAVGRNDERQASTIGAFEIMGAAVTHEQFALFDRARERKLRQEPFDPVAGPSTTIGVSWFDAFIFCKWLGPGFRLPTKAEMESACQRAVSEWTLDCEGDRGRLFAFRVPRTS